MNPRKHLLPIFILLFMSADLFSDISVLEQFEEADNSGKECIYTIVSKIKHDVIPDSIYPILYTKTTNVDKDLNLQAIVDVVAPKTLMGKSYLYELLQRPVSPFDQSGAIQLRQNIIKELVKNPQFKTQLESLLDIAASEEQDVITLMSNSFKNKTCPELDDLKKLKDENSFFYETSNFMITHRIPITYNFISETIALPIFWLSTGVLAYGACNDEFRQKFLSEYDFTECAGYSLSSGLFSALFSYAYYDQLVKAGEKRSKMHALNQIIHIAENLESLCCQNKIAPQF